MQYFAGPNRGTQK